MKLRVRKKKNKSGSTSILIVDRSDRGYKVVENLGFSKDKDEIEKLYKRALQRIDELERNLLFISKENNKKESLKELLSNLTTQDFIPIGDELIFGKIFNDIGCKDIFLNSNAKIRNKEEKDFLKKHPIIKVSNEKDWLPFDFMQNGNATGYSIDIIKKLSKNEEKYKEFIEQYNRPLKEGIYQDFTNKEALLELVRYKSTNDPVKMTSLADYKERADSSQKVIYYIIGEDEQILRNSPLMEAYKKNNIEVLILDDKEIDEVVKRKGYSSRSELIRDAVRKYVLESNPLDKNEVVSGIIIVVYNPTKESLERMSKLYFEYNKVIKSLNQAYVTTSCGKNAKVEIFVVEGNSKDVSKFYDGISKIDGKIYDKVIVF